MGILIDEARCIGCGLCEISCAYDAIDVHIKARVDNDKCTDCTVCPDYCPTDAIAMEAPPVRPALSAGEATFDAVVIGSGLGGLCSGVLLAHRGYRTLVLERNASVGGRFSSLKHEKVMIPTGGSLIGIGGPLEQVCREVEAPFDVVAFQVSAYWVRGRGWVDPGSGAGQLRRALIEISGAPEAVDAVMSAMRSTLASDQYPSGSMLQWLRSLTDNRGIEEMFRAITAAAFGPEDVPAADFFGLLAATAGKGMGLARRGLIHLMGGLAKAITRRGGEVWTRSEARSITLDGNTATGVLVDRRGQPCRVSARVVISNTGPRQTVQLLGPQSLDREYLAYLDQRVQAVNSISVHLISDRSLLADIPGAIYTVVGARRICMIFDASLTAQWSAPGVHITEIYPLTVPDPETPVDWETLAEETAEDLDDMSPGWRQHAEMKLLCLEGEYPGLRAWPGLGASVETPISNLLLVGDGCESRGYAGGAAAAASAQRAVALAQERLPPT